MSAQVVQETEIKLKLSHFPTHLIPFIVAVKNIEQTYLVPSKTLETNLPPLDQYAKELGAMEIKEARIRNTDNRKYTLTFKSSGTLSRNELELPLTPEEYTLLYASKEMHLGTLFKRRHVMRGMEELLGLTLEIDEYVTDPSCSTPNAVATTTTTSTTTTTTTNSILHNLIVAEIEYDPQTFHHSDVLAKVSRLLKMNDIVDVMDVTHDSIYKNASLALLSQVDRAAV
jgi:hypothetical protein